MGVNRRQRRRLDGHAAAILMYHRVLPEARAVELAVEPGMFVTPASFAAQLDWLRDSFSVLPLHEITSRLAGDQPLPEGACAITFDDGWRDNVEFALPALRSRDMPATVFVVSERVGTNGSFWADEVVRRMALLSFAEGHRVAEELGASGPPGGPADERLLAHCKAASEEARQPILETLRSLTPDPADAGRELADWDEVDELARSGVDIESHGASHTILTGVSPAEARDDLARALSQLRDRGHARHGLLAYPSGALDDTVVALARELGHTAAVTTERRIARRGDDPLQLPRLGVHEDISRTRAEFLSKVPGAW